MYIDIHIRRTNEDGDILCFTHAVQEATKGVKIEEEIIDGEVRFCSLCYPDYGFER